MYKAFTIILILLSLGVLGQKNPNKEAQSIVVEGKLLYKSEMASWYGTDLFLNNYKKRENIGGYFSYSENDTAKCVFFSKTDNPRVIGTITFDGDYDVNRAKTDLTERDFTYEENKLYQIRKIALTELQTNENAFFKFYENTNPNIIPLSNGKEKKVYILTGPQQSGVVIFGNDYLLTFDNNNNLISKKQLHKNIISIEYGNADEGLKVEGTMHSHLPETGDFITATDIYTLMLYESFAKWKTHNVISEKYLNIWNCETDQLTIIPMSEVDKINKDQEKRKKKK
ncbi:MAG: hypothetical protein KDB74_06310 [Flavobacteriales bacterium]|nr:hypothetical protein [Flavobacteriales bacterium]